MFWDKEKVITVYEVPEAIEGDPYIRTPNEKDKSVKTMRQDRETGEWITLWEEKLRYPYKTKLASTLVVKTNLRTLNFNLKLEKDCVTGIKCFIWNGQNIPTLLWSILGISKDSPIGLLASKWHDYLLYKKEDILNSFKEKDIDINYKQYRRLTTLIYSQILKNYGVNTVKANIMAGAVGAWQFVSPQWWGIEK